jgi:hypothetical protein
MQNKYVRDIIQAIQGTNYNTIMVFKGRLSAEEMNLISEVAVQYKKIVIFALMHELLFNNDKNALVVM